MTIIEKAIPVVGGGYPNYRVLNSTTEPTTAAENTIWVNTSTKIHYHEFSIKEPFKRSNNKNLNVYPYAHTTQTTNGITFTDNRDGSITANGTATGSSNTFFRCSHTGRKWIYLTAGTYTLSGCSGGSSSTYQIELGYSYDEGVTTSFVTAPSGPTTFTLTQDAIARISIKVISGTTVSNLKFYPQLEKGSLATSFIKGDATGQVWFLLGYNSAAPFSIIKGNGINIYPIKCSQWNGSSWVTKISKIYKYGTWKQYVSPIAVIPNTSNTYTRVLRASDNTAASTACSNLTEITNAADKVYVYHGSKNSIMSAYYLKLDVSGYNTMTIKGTAKIVNSSVHYIGLFTTYDHVLNYNTMLAGYKGSSTTINQTYDISNINGEVYLMIAAYTTSSSNSYPETTVTSLILNP